jgi:hypothetical protein
MTQVDKDNGEPIAHHTIHFETHMEVYERCSSSGLGGEASDSPNFHQFLICWLAKAGICHDMTQVDKGEQIEQHKSILTHIWKL